ncbi:hypothetical protein TNCV_416231 [Trichonephila clavipes]|nr:hypothetical protein TNCV_416231 [Trichonephila clavipes]
MSLCLVCVLSLWCSRVLPEGKEGKLPEPETSWTSRGTPVVGRSLKRHIADSMIFNSVPPQVSGETPWGSGASPLTSPQPTSLEELRLDGYLEYIYVAKALYIYKHPRFLRDSYPGPTTQQSASLITLVIVWGLIGVIACVLIGVIACVLIGVIACVLIEVIACLLIGVIACALIGVIACVLI